MLAHSSPTAPVTPVAPAPDTTESRVAHRGDAGHPERVLRERLAAAQRGERRALEDVLALLDPLVRGTARRCEAYARHLGLGASLEREDLVQQGRVYLCTLAEQYDADAGPALGFFAFRLRAAMRHYVVKTSRGRPRGRHLAAHRPDVDEMLQVRCERDATERTGWTHSGADAALHEALGHLSPRVRGLLYEVYWRQRPLDEAAATIGLSATAARQARLRALTKLRLELERGGMRAAGRASDRTKSGGEGTLPRRSCAAPPAPSRSHPAADSYR